MSRKDAYFQQCDFTGIFTRKINLSIESIMYWMFKKSDFRIFPLTSYSIMMVANERKVCVTKEIFGRKAVEKIGLKTHR